MRKGKSIQSNIHEYRKLRSSILSGYMPGRICEGYVRFSNLNFGIPTQKIRANEKKAVCGKKSCSKLLYFSIVPQVELRKKKIELVRGML